METQGLPAAAEAAQPEPAIQQHGAGADDGAAPSGPVRRPPQPRDSAGAAAAGAWGLDVTFPVLLLLEGKLPEPPQPPQQLPPPPPLPPPGPANSGGAPASAALSPPAGGPGQPPESDALLLVLNLVRGGASGSPSRGSSQDSPPAQRPREGKPGGEAGGEGQASATLSEGGGSQEEGGEGGGQGNSSFSGTLTINNQSLLVRFENGTLSFGGPAPAAPPPAPPQPSDDAQPPAASSRAPASYPRPDSHCAETFSRKQLLRLHQLSARGGSPTGAGQEGGEAAAAAAPAPSAGAGRAARPFSCPIPGCSWAFATAYKLRRHLHSHDKLRPFACSAPGCTKRFTTIYNLRAHGRAHEEEARLKCEACGQRFPSAARLGAHQRRSHLEPDRPYRCEYPGNLVDPDLVGLGKLLVCSVSAMNWEKGRAILNRGCGLVTYGFSVLQNVCSS